MATCGHTNIRKDSKNNDHNSPKKEQLERIWRERFQTELNDALKIELRQAALVGVKSCLEEALRQELSEHLGFGRYQRTGTGPQPAPYLGGWGVGQPSVPHR